MPGIVQLGERGRRGMERAQLAEKESTGGTDRSTELKERAR